MNALEQRLAETEKALFFALSEVHSGAAIQGDYDSQPPDRSMHPSALSTAVPTHQQQKCDLMASWASQPLKNRNEAHAWLRSRQASTYQFVRESSGTSMGERSPHEIFTPSVTNPSHGIDALRPPTSSGPSQRGSSSPQAKKKRTRAPNGIRREGHYGSRWLENASIIQFDMPGNANEGGNTNNTNNHPAPAPAPTPTPPTPPTAAAAVAVPVPVVVAGVPADSERNSKARRLARGQQDIYF